MVRLIVFVGDEIEHYERSVSVFEADTPSGAHARAIALGRDQECTYNNQNGDIVCWRLGRVETLDVLGADLGGGREVYSEAAAYDDEPLPEKPPEDLAPGSAGVAR